MLCYETHQGGDPKQQLWHVVEFENQDIDLDWSRLAWTEVNCSTSGCRVYFRTAEDRTMFLLRLRK